MLGEGCCVGARFWGHIATPALMFAPWKNRALQVRGYGRRAGVQRVQPGEEGGWCGGERLRGAGVVGAQRAGVTGAQAWVSPQLLPVFCDVLAVGGA